MNKKIKKGISKMKQLYANDPLWRRLFIFAVCLLLFTLFVLFGLSRLENSNFVAINGDFQNYNGYRRLLDGQIPFKDFVFYLGLGPLYLHSIVLLIIGNTFTHSLFATYFLSAAAFSFCIYVVARLNALRPLGSIVLVAVFAATAAGYNYYLAFLNPVRNFSFFLYFYPGVSDRIIRSLVPFLCVAAVALFILLAKRSKRVQQVQDYIIENQWRLFFTIGCLFGIILPWSNDYGISAALAGAIILGIRYFKFTLTFFLQYTTFFIALVIGTVSSVTLLTFGHLVEWFDYNFIGVGSYQQWYYAVIPQVKAFSMYDVPFGDPVLLVSLYLVLVLLYREQKKQNTLAQTGLLFLFLSTAIASYLYVLVSNIEGLHEPVRMIFWVSVFSFVTTLMPKMNAHLSRVLLLVFLSVFSYAVYQKYEDVHKLFSTPRTGYHESLGGFTPEFHEDLILLNELIPDGEKVFSTYASALEVELGQFQPSGYDYTIHVLGDRQRAQYLQSFFDTDPQFVTTIREGYSHWELWNVRANWFFYREMLKTHEPIFASHYNVLWKKREAPFNSSVTATCQVDKKNHQLKIQADTTDSELYADVKLSYTTSWKHRLKSLGIQKAVYVQDKSTFFFLPETANNVDIPVQLYQGKGVVKINSYPLGETLLDITECSVSQVLPALTEEVVSKEYAYNVSSLTQDTFQVAELTDSNWAGGVRTDGAVMLVPYSLVNRTSLGRIQQVVGPAGTVVDVVGIEVSAPQWISVYLKTPLLTEEARKEFAFPAKLKIID